MKAFDYTPASFAELAADYNSYRYIKDDGTSGRKLLNLGNGWGWNR